MRSLFPSFQFPQLLFPTVRIVLLCLGLWPLSAFGHQAGEFYQKAVEAIQGNNLQQAELLLQQAIKEFPAYAEAHHLLGMVHYQHTQDPNTAIPSLKHAVELNPNFPQAQYDLGLLLLKQERMEEAQQVIQQALSIYPGFWEARLTLAKIFDQTGATENAIQEYEAVLRQQPTTSEALYLLAYQLMQRNHIERAQELLTVLYVGRDIDDCREAFSAFEAVTALLARRDEGAASSVV